MHCAIWKKISSGMYNPAQAGNNSTIRKKYDGGELLHMFGKKSDGRTKSQRGSKRADAVICFLSLLIAAL